MAERVQVARREGERTMSELIRDAFRTDRAEREWVRVVRYDRLRERECDKEMPEGGI